MNRPLKVAVVAASLRILGGQAIQARRILDGFAGDARIDAWLVPINPIPPRPFDRLLQIRFVRTIVTQLCYWPLLARELRRADIVHVFSASYTSFLLSPLPAIVVAKLLGKPVLLNYHSGEASDHLRRSPIARFVLGRVVDLNVVPSSYLRDVFASYDLSARVVANSVDLARFAYRPRIDLRPRLISTRSLEPLYNVACTLRAFARVQASHPAATLTVIGAGSQHSALRKLAEDLRLTRVSFLGQVAPSDMPRHYADADIYVQTPSIDNMPLSLLEASASGLPVVSTRVGGVPAILRDHVDGLLVDDDDDAGVAAAVEDVLTRPDAARSRAAAAYERCAALEWPVVRQAWHGAYSTLQGTGWLRRPSAGARPARRSERAGERL